MHCVAAVFIVISLKKMFCILYIVDLPVLHFSVICYSDILRKYESTHESILPRLLSSHDVMTSPDGRAALFWIIGEYGEVSLHTLQ